jgi:hypothetical protein
LLTLLLALLAVLCVRDAITDFGFVKETGQWSLLVLDEANQVLERAARRKHGAEVVARKHDAERDGRPLSYQTGTIAG